MRRCRTTINEISVNQRPSALISVLFSGQDNMNRSHEIILVTVSSLVVLCLCIVAAGVVAMRSAGWYLARTFVTNPATVAEISSSITDYTLPAGFSNAYAARVASFSLVSYTGNDGHSHIYLFHRCSSLQIILESYLVDDPNHTAETS